jgi:phosphoenolpyruvate-protein kinase (PTS system EI component)
VRDAFATVGDEFLALADEMKRKGLREEAAILTAESAIARDAELLDGVLSAMVEGTPAGKAIQDVGEEFALTLENLESEYLRERAADIRQVVRRTLAVLAGGHGSSAPTKPFILMDTDVGPVDLLQVAAEGLAGAVSLRGGVNAHSSIVARSLGIPFLIGVDVAPLGIEDGVEVLLDADRAALILDPSADERIDANQRIAAAAAQRDQYALERDFAAETVDGRAVTVMCNVASAPEARIGFDAHASGVGLLRTELPFLDANQWPTESKHRETLTPIFSELDGISVTVRVMDFSNDKVPPFLEPGLEGIEALLAHPDALREQIRAVLDVGRRAQTRLMLPMVRTPEEVNTVRAMVREIAAELALPEPKLGIMVELPETADRAAELAQVSDFFSLGTNDLTASVLQLARTEQGMKPAMAADPRVLRHIAATVKAADEAGISVSVCGDAGGDPLVLPLLIGAGLRAFSVSATRVDEVRYRLRRIDAGEWAERLPEALELDGIEAVWDYVRVASAH